MIEADNILITGVNGFIGSNLAKECVKRGYNVIGIDIASTTIIPQICYHQLNLYTDSIDAIVTLYKPYAVIHCAGMADVGYSVKHPESDFISNVIVSRNVLYSIKDCSKKSRFIYLSSAAVYGDPSVTPINEKVERNPISPYALHKTLVEDMCWYFIRQYDMDIRILRIFSAYGNGLRKQIFWDMGQKLAKTKQLELFGTGNETRDFIHIRDLVDAILLVMNVTDTSERIYNIANGKENSIRKITEIFCCVLGLKADIINFNQQTRAGNPTHWCADISKLLALGYSQTISIEKGIEEYVNWLKEEKIIL